MKPTWQSDCGRVQLYNADCLHVLPTLGAGSVDVAITDPPYGIGYGYLGYEDSVENLGAVVIPAVRLCIGIAARVATFCGLRHAFKYPEPAWILAWAWKGTNTYGDYGVNQWQPILCYGKDLKGFGSINGMIKSDCIHYEGGNCGEVKDMKSHPCPKNLGIMTRLAKRLSNEGEIVCDPFMGSGTTGVACVRLGRKFLGIEREPTYFETAKQRIQEEISRVKSGFGLLNPLTKKKLPPPKGFLTLPK